MTIAVPIERLAELERAERELKMIRGERKPLTRAQTRTLDAVKTFIAVSGYAPTFTEIGERLKVSKVTIWEHIKELERKGWIVREGRYSRSIRLV